MLGQGTIAKWFVTGGLGFIGSCFIRHVLATRPNVSIVNYDIMNYAANEANLADAVRNKRYRFIKGDICDQRAVESALEDGTSAIVNFAAQTHVDRSISAPSEFLRTDVMGTHVLLEVSRARGIKRFLQVSTDEVYGHVPQGESLETDVLVPRSPYAASKAGADLQVLAYATTYGLSILITRGCNTFGPHQFPEKLIPLFVTNLFDGLQVPLYGDGLQVREWLHVEDHVAGILHVLECGVPGNVYNLGTGDLRTNLEVAQRLSDLCGRSPADAIRHVEDRAGHDRRYALDSSKANRLGWYPAQDFTRQLGATVDWYRSNEGWWRPLRRGDFADYYRRQYTERMLR